MAPIPRYRHHEGIVILSAGFRPFFLLAALWACAVVPVSVGFITGAVELPTAFPPLIWHVHEMVFGYGSAVVAGFLLTAIPNWTGRLPLQGGPLAALLLAWFCGRIAVLFSLQIGNSVAAVVDLIFPVVFLGVVVREIIAGRNWRNLPMVGALLLLLIGNALTHYDAVRFGDMGGRLGVATLLMLICLIGGRIVPSFTRNWLVKQDSNSKLPAPFSLVDQAALTMTVIALFGWTIAPESEATSWLALGAGGSLAVRLLRWRGENILSEPLLWVLHLGYGWLAVGLLILALNGLMPLLPATSAIHALTVGAIGTMTLAVMTRAALGHTGRALVAGPRTTMIYILITAATILRLLAPLFGSYYLVGLTIAVVSWCGAFGSFAIFYFRPLTRIRVGAQSEPPI